MNVFIHFHSSIASVLFCSGGQIFKTLKNGEYAKTDEYVSHLVTSRDRRYILLLSQKQVFCLEKGDVIHDWNIEWHFAIDQMPEPPNMVRLPSSID